MKLIRCHIENFGKLQNYDYSFEEGLNLIKEKNGFGKTTLATFIKAMIYGLPATTKKDINQNIRKKYTPWQAGAFGGYIEAEIAGKKYRIERFFGKKESEDTFKVIDLATGKQTNKFSSDLGVDVFGIDGQAYERSTYIPQQKLEQGVNESIQNRLTSILHGSDNSESLALALASLDKRKAELKNKQNKGLISSIDEKIGQSEIDIDGLKLKYKDCEKIKLQVKEYDEIIENLNKDHQKIEDDIKTFNKIQQKIDSQKYIEENKEKLQKHILIVEKNDEILNKNDELSKKSDEFAEKNKKLEELKTKIKTINDTSFLKQEKKQLDEYFKGTKVSKEKVESLILKEQNLDKINAEKILSTETKNKNLSIIVGLILSFIFAAGGILLVHKKITIGVILFVLTFLSLCFCAFVYFKNLIELKTSQTKTDRIQNSELLFETRKELSEFISSTNEPLSDVRLNLFNIKAKVEQYEVLENKLKKENQLIQELQLEVDGLSSEIEEFLSNFKIDKHGDQAFAQIKQAYKDKNESLNEITEINNKLAKLNDLEDLDYELVNRFKGQTFDDLISKRNSVQEKIDEQKEKRSKLEVKIKALNEDISELDDIEYNLEFLKEEKAILEKEFKLINSTKDFLKEANDSLTSKYISPMYEGLMKFLKLSTTEELEKINLNTELKVSFESQGALRELSYMSEGYQTIVNLALRLALVETIFTTEKPFIVLDDPFVNLDEEKTEKAVKLIKELSREYQIIYLVCHNSRV